MKQTAIEIVKILRNAGHQALFAGGCVRDHIMGREPLDYDIATSALPEDVERLFPRTVSVGKSFGVIRILTPDGDFEVATFRSDGPYLNGRRPAHVRFSTAREDVLRRDFTINGLLYDPIEDRVIDYVGGVADIAAKLIRTIGNPTSRFSEDYLRMIRAVRFACQLGFQIEESVLSSIQDLAHNIRNISWERIRDELLKILTSPLPGKGIELLDLTGLLQHILPEISAMKGVPQHDNFHPEGDVFTHTVLALNELATVWYADEGQRRQARGQRTETTDQRPVPNHAADMPQLLRSAVCGLRPAASSLRSSLALATLLHDVAKPSTIQKADRIRFPRHESIGAKMAADICQRLRLSTDETKTVSWLVSKHMVLRDFRKMRTHTKKKLICAPNFPQLMTLLYVDRMASNMDMQDFDDLVQIAGEYAKEDIIPPPLISGHDLIAIGLKPGPIFRDILQKIGDLQLEGKISTKQEALDMARIIGFGSPHAKGDKYGMIQFFSEPRA